MTNFFQFINLLALIKRLGHILLSIARYKTGIQKGGKMNYLEIEKVIGREILDSRGNPTVEA
ncbi:MAG: hypothetical protein K6G87_04720, partial [Butyrivibrio sp.]|uniref:hypothetical protein n=1 Tax=Butyrivibrio sp. TaxID=28121 RepID=UPI0025F2D96B